jgi:elongation factor P
LTHFSGQSQHTVESSVHFFDEELDDVITTTDFRNGSRLELDGQPYYIVEFQHVKPGKGPAFVRTKLKGYKTGNVIDRTFRSGEKFDEPNLEERDMQFLYNAGEEYAFMDVSSFDQFTYRKSQLGENVDLLKDNTVVKILLYHDEPIAVELPVFMELKVVETDPGIRGDTASGGTKLAVVETGAAVKVPLYLEAGEVIKIDTRTRAYVERVR